MLFEYDFGDGWEHNIELQKILPFDFKEKLPRVIRGKRECPPEECGDIIICAKLSKIKNMKSIKK